MNENPLPIEHRKAISRKGYALLLMALLSLAGCSPSGEARNASSAGSAAEPSTPLPFSESSTIFEIIPDESQARFLIDEIFWGDEKTVFGQTGKVTGQLGVDFADLSTAAAGPIQVNARTLETDNGYRNRAIQNQVLLTRIYEFVTFTPTAVKGLPENSQIGEPLTFQIEGDLTITAYTQPATFEVTAVPLSESRIEGKARTTINRGDFELFVPDATNVAAVAEEVILELDFVATATD
ncbi:MAG: YceI family protein [Chloroflexi bacterium]|nr:YceI family protein [Chloroflexota bacterium]